METIIATTIQFMMFSAVGSYFGHQLRKKEEPEVKFNWFVLVLTQPAIILGGVAGYFTFVK